MKNIRRTGGGSTLLLIAFAILSGGLLVGLVFERHGRLEKNERRAVEALKRLAEAEADFAGNDRDGNRVIDYWTDDVAGLSRWVDQRWIPWADAGHPIAFPFHGYLFIAMTVDGRGQPYREETAGIPGGPKQKNHEGFGFCAYPASYGRSGRSTFIINERNKVRAMDTGGRPVLAWPADPERAGWTIHD